jgi:septum formation protein
MTLPQTAADRETAVGERVPRLVLASASLARRRLLEAAGLAFEVLPADVDEAGIKLRARATSTPPQAIAEMLAKVKAEAVGGRRPDCVVIGADQVLTLGEEIFDKPQDVGAARTQLARLRGKVHVLHTAAALAVAGKGVWSGVEQARLAMRPFTDAFLADYVARAGPDICRSVGAYEIEGRGIQLFERIDGDYFSIIGLPLLALLAELRRRGVIGR